MLDGLEIGLDRRLDDELEWQLPAQGAVRSTVGVFSIFGLFSLFHSHFSRNFMHDFGAHPP